MTNLFLTLIIAFIVIVLAMACLAIGWLLTGRNRVERACGRDPTKKRDENCKIKDSCLICESDKKTNMKKDD